ncbi:hypothetical protein [Streptomyces sp. YS415]|uniref:hypothetical protein n=1 Tax=Streptomyces sp. YS415 TaxID=2944806 RepID=UPI0020216277|nr:hypothetical protein [Streptomyces sp. YS415]MCL7424104.1 hypothetical protein [Streptomyces sp. YS415]
MAAGWCTRTIRAAVFAAVCVLLAALGHVLMSGSHVPGWALAAGVAGTGAVGWCLGGRERGLPLVVTVVVAAQTGLHSGFSWAQSASTSGASAGEVGAGHVHSVDVAHMHHGGFGYGSASGSGSGAMTATAEVSPSVGMPAGGSVGGFVEVPVGTVAGMSAGMVAAHLLAALLCGLWLAYGEKAAFRILRAVAGWLAAPLRLLLALPAPADRSPRPRLGRGRADRVPRLLLVHAITSRGPPVGPAVA